MAAFDGPAHARSFEFTMWDRFMPAPWANYETLRETIEDAAFSATRSLYHGNTREAHRLALLHDKWWELRLQVHELEFADHEARKQAAA